MKFFSKELSQKLSEIGCVGDDTLGYDNSGHVRPLPHNSFAGWALDEFGPYHDAFSIEDFLGDSPRAMENCKKLSAITPQDLTEAEPFRVYKMENMALSSFRLQRPREVYRRECGVMNQDESLFGKGFVYCLGLFLCHADKRFDDKKNNLPSWMWLDGAKDHIYEFDADIAPIQLRDVCVNFKKSVLNADKDSLAWDNVEAMVKCAKDILFMYDQLNGFKPMRGSYE